MSAPPSRKMAELLASMSVPATALGSAVASAGASAPGWCIGRGGMRDGADGQSVVMLDWLVHVRMVGWVRQSPRDGARSMMGLARLAAVAFLN